jgi:hypothetical protein
MAEGHDTDIRNSRTGPLTEWAASESTVTGVVQLVPSKVTTFPPAPSTAAQKLLVGHDTTGQEIPPSPILRPFGSALTGALQVLPLNVNASEPLPTAAQKLGDEHDTDAMPLWVLGTGSLMLGAELPRAAVEQKVDESCASTAMQKLTVGHDTDVGSSPPWL